MMTKIKERWTNELEVSNFTNAEGTPTGGTVTGVGLAIKWQEGALKEPDGTEHEPNGAFVEDVILAAIQRLNYFQTESNRKFATREGACAITHLEEALMWLDKRHDNRVARGVQGFHKV